MAKKTLEDISHEIEVNKENDYSYGTKYRFNR